MRVHMQTAGSGPPIVCTPGIGKTADDWTALTTELSDQHSVVTWDLLGHGKSPVPEEQSEYTRDRALDDLDDVIAAARTTDPDAPLVLLGHSLGGYLTLAWQATRTAAEHPSPAALVVMATGPGFRDDAKREAWNERSRRNAHRFGVPPQAAELNLQEDGVVIQQVPEMTVPTLVIVGSEDRADIQGGCGYLAAKLANAELVTIDGGDHLMHEDPVHAAAIAAAIGAFLG